jgi:transposase
MRAFTFTDQDLAAIRHDRFHHPHPRVQQRMEVLWLKSKGLAHTEIVRLTELGRRTVQRYLDAYLDGGVAAVKRLGWRGTRNQLAGHRPDLEAYFLENPPRSAAEARAVIEELTGVRRGLTQVRQFLKKVSACAGARPA